MQAVEVKTPSVREVKELCIRSYRSFLEANRLLAEARARTAAAEKAMAAARARRESGADLGEEERAALLEASSRAGASLGAVNDALDEAEELVRSCDLKRAELRVLLEGV